MLFRSAPVVLLVAAHVVGCGRYGFDAASADDPDAAATADAAAADAVANADAAALDGCGGAELLCDGFEAGLVEWTPTASGGTVELVAAPVFRGAQAVRVQTDAPGAVAYVTRVHPAVASGTLYTRAYFYIPSSVVTVGLAELTNTGDDTGIHSHLTLDDGLAGLVVNSSSPAPVITWPRDRWTCVEIDIDVGPSGGGQVRVDGQVAAAVTGLDTAVPGGYSDHDIGLYYTDPSTTSLELFIDEVAVDTSPIGCL